MPPKLVLGWFVHSLLAVLILLVPLLLLIIKNPTSKKIRLPPSPPRLPFVGNLHQVGSLAHRSLRSLSEKHGPLMLLHMGQVPTLVVSSAEIAREIMKTHDLVFASRPSVKVATILLGGRDMVFAPYGEHWRQVRKLCINHLLSTKMVQSFRLVREEEVGSLIAKISMNCSSQGQVDIIEVLNLFANNILCRVVLGKLFSGEGRDNIFCKLIEENLVLLGKFSVEDYFPSLGWLDAVSGLEARVRRVSKRWDAVFDEVIEDHANRLEENADFVDVLLGLEKDPSMNINLNRELIRMLLQDMIAAGTDTTSVVLEWGMAELVRNPEAMKNLQNEVRGIANRESMVREEDLSRMSYLKAVIKEVLRLHPPLPLLIPRESMANCQIQGYEVPVKARVLINAWAIGRDPKFWKAPEEFRPERFLTSTIDFKGHDFQFIPFGAGRRICPGVQFAVPTLELALANLVHMFDWKLPAGMEMKDLDMTEAPGLTTHKKQKLYLVAEPAFVRKALNL